MAKHKQFVSYLPTNCLSVFGHSVGLVLKGLTSQTLKRHLLRKSIDWFHYDDSRYFSCNLNELRRSHSPTASLKKISPDC